MTGKKKCEFLKKLREEIAKENGIAGFEYKECPFEGDCAGTCPACDAELEVLSNELKRLGKEVSAVDLNNIEKMRQKDTFIKPSVLMGKMKAPVRTPGALRAPDDYRKQERIVLGEMKVSKPTSQAQEINNNDYTDADFPDEFDIYDENSQKVIKGILPADKIKLEGELVADPRPMMGKVMDLNSKKNPTNREDGRKPRGLIGKLKKNNRNVEGAIADWNTDFEHLKTKKKDGYGK